MTGKDALPDPGELDAGEWLALAAEAVAAATRAAIERHATTPEQAALLLVGLSEAPAPGPHREVVSCMHLPLLAYCAAGGPAADALPLACATTMLEAGSYLLDHAVDGELGGVWEGRSGAAILAAVIHGGPLARRALSSLPRARLLAVHAELDRGLLATAAGQQLDVHLGRSSQAPSLDDLLAAAAGKSGGRRSCEVRIASALAGVRLDALASFAVEYGIARQLASDLVDLAGRRPSRDLASATWTWPLAWHARRLEGDRRDAFLAARRAAVGDPAVAAQLCDDLRDGGALLRTALEAQRHCERARRHLDDAGAPPAVTEVLARVLRSAELRP